MATAAPSFAFEYDGFVDYQADTNKTPQAFLTFATVYVGLAMLILIPIAAWSNDGPNEENEKIDNIDNVNDGAEQAKQQTTLEDSRLDDGEMFPPWSGSGDSMPQPPAGDIPETSSGLFKDTKAKDFGSSCSDLFDKSIRPLDRAESGSALPASVDDMEDHGASSGRRASSPERRSSSKLHFKHIRPLGKADSIRRGLRAERQSFAVNSPSEEGSQGSKRSKSSIVSKSGLRRQGSRRVSDAASSVLSGEIIEGEAEFYRQKYVLRAQRRLRRSSDSDRSLMPALSPDAISPEDAADAHDPGKVNAVEDYEKELLVRRGIGSLSHFDSLFSLVEFDFEVKRILMLAFPSTIRAVADPLFRLVMAAIISHFINNDSMVAYVLVTLFLRISSEEVASSILDVESSMIQACLGEDGDAGSYNAGRAIQSALWMQLLLGAAVLGIWAYFMEDVVFWLVASRHIASIAKDYVQVIVGEYGIRAISRSFMLPFQMGGKGQFETNVDLFATVATLIAIAAILSTSDQGAGNTLRTIGLAQVIVAACKLVIKVCFVARKGWLTPYLKGLIGSISICSSTYFVLQLLPLLVGSVMELGEWDILALLVRALGGAEVATWALIGIGWEVLLSLTEGICEAISIRVSFYILEDEFADARRLSFKGLFLVFVQALLVTSIIIMGGPNLAVTLSTDPTMQNMMFNMVGMVGLANVSMTVAQASWSLAGAQGRFGLASTSILLSRFLVIMPIACTCIFYYEYELDAVVGAIAVGYATASVALLWNVYGIDWSSLKFSEGDMLLPTDALLEFDDDDDEDDDDDDSDL